MITIRAVFLLWLLFILNYNGITQDFTFTTSDMVLSGELGTDIVFNCTITNTSQLTLTLAIIRTVNNLPQNWESSLCFNSCFPPDTDTILTTPEYGSTPLNPGESRPFSVHVFPMITLGTGIVKIVVLNTRNPSDQQSLTFTAHASSTGMLTEDDLPVQFSLSQNYPNPFNPSTKIQYKISKQTAVKISIFDICGRHIITLVNNEKEPGRHEVFWNGLNKDGIQVGSGVYFYRFIVDNKKEIKKFTLLK